MTLDKQLENFNVVPATDEEMDIVYQYLVAFNAEQVPLTQTPTFIHKNYIIKDNDEIVAGIKSLIYGWKLLRVDILFVDKRYRRHDFGSYLLQRVENEARDIGVTLSHLDTFDFQAKDFYLKQGYEIFGTLDECPPGHKRYYLKKKL